MIKTKGVLHITIPVSDLARSRAFYTDVLGLEFIAQAPKHNPHFVFLKSGADYVVLGREDRPERFSDIIHHAFMIDGDAYDATVAELKAKGVHVFREDERREGVFTGRSAYFHDPDNNALEVIHLTNNAKTNTTLSFVHSTLVRYKVGAEIPPGTYTVKVWHERMAAPLEQRVVVAPGGTGRLELTLTLK